MKIIEVNKFHFFRRGTSRHYFDLIAALERAGHTVAHFSMHSKENIPSEWEKYFVSYVGYNRNDSTFFERLIGIGRLFWSFEARKKMHSLCQNFKPDVVHVHNAYHQLSLAFFPLVKKANIPLVMTVHDYALVSPDKDIYYRDIGKHYWKFLFVKKYGFGKRLLLVLKKYWEDMFRLYDYVDQFVVPSRYVFNVLIDFGIPRKKIFLLHHFIPKGESGVQAPSNVSLPDRYLFSYGAISYEKGIQTLLSLAKSIGLPLVLAGRIESGYDPEKESGTLYLGMRSRQELNFLVQNAACVVAASENPEPFGLTALETITFGKPFFALKRGALSEIIENGKTGYLAENPEEFERAVSEYLTGKNTYLTPEEIQAQAWKKFGKEDEYIVLLTKLMQSI